MVPPSFSPIAPVRVPVPPAGRDWLVELKIDGFRGVAVLGHGDDALFSKTGRRFTRFDPLVRDLAAALPSRAVVLDGEIACLDAQGRPDFAALMRRQQLPVFFAFDLLAVDGEDLRLRPLLERKRRLRRLIRGHQPTVQYVPHVRGAAPAFFEAACRMDLEGIVCKPVHSVYRAAPTPPWRKVLNPSYSQKNEARFALFERQFSSTL